MEKKRSKGVIIIAVIDIGFCILCLLSYLNSKEVLGSNIKIIHWDVYLCTSNRKRQLLRLYWHSMC